MVFALVGASKHVDFRVNDGIVVVEGVLDVLEDFVVERSDVELLQLVEEAFGKPVVRLVLEASCPRRPDSDPRRWHGAVPLAIAIVDGSEILVVIGAVPAVEKMKSKWKESAARRDDFVAVTGGPLSYKQLYNTGLHVSGAPAVLLGDILVVPSPDPPGGRWDPDALGHAPTEFVWVEVGGSFGSGNGCAVGQNLVAVIFDSNSSPDSSSPGTSFQLVIPLVTAVFLASWLVAIGDGRARVQKMWRAGGIVGAAEFGVFSFRFHIDWHPAVSLSNKSVNLPPPPPFSVVVAREAEQTSTT